ncbi:RNA-binding S4 domain-containing protein [Pseudooceanicola atlanticus]|jgi:ribosome-associated heat shock protein Hsp15|uniref:tRNA synthetase RNA-binding protein n=1 Tax=Pseudooceanicola atlanticus TaxID=1461694 RepID=A0A0A0ECY2_9RHOB|nr:RNA-binding S4 domain-containing protein [Pseudooceanicola atlanticus]KGM47933.1 tRNA synthetase RNA-binding protein [Pseudooceanicola atlanticus]
MSEKAEKFRLDKWLWQARFVKSRSLAAALVTGGHVRVNSDRASKASYGVQVGDVLTFPQGDRIRVVRILAPAKRRGPATEAQTLYDDMSPAPEPKAPKIAARDEGNARPTKRDRRQMDRLREKGPNDALE